MIKERNFNPAQAQHKADKAKAIKKGKAEQQARRNEKLAQRNPERIQKQIADLKAIQDGGGKLTPVEEQALEALEKDLKAVKKAREALGDRAPTFSGGPGGGRGDGVLGKRRRDPMDDDSTDSDVPDDVRRIPMPRDTPPPISREVMDEWWAKRRARRGQHQQQQQQQNRDGDQHRGSNANTEPIGEGRGSRVQQRQEGGSEQQLPRRERPPHAPPPPPPEARTVYEAKPVVRDLRKEASAFVPTAVRARVEKSKGQGGMPEPEGGSDKAGATVAKQATIEEVEDEEG